MQNKNLPKCNYCGAKFHLQGELCPATGKHCNKCKQPNHFASMCSSKTIAESTTFEYEKIVYQSTRKVEKIVHGTINNERNSYRAPNCNKCGQKSHYVNNEICPAKGIS